jgi:hypothetical protein
VPKMPGSPQITDEDPEYSGSRRDPEERATANAAEHEEKLLDKALADTFPTSDPPAAQAGSVDSAAEASRKALLAKLIQDYPPGTWVAVSIDDQRVVGVAQSSEEAEQKAKLDGYLKLWLVQVPQDAPIENTDQAA